MHAYLIMTHNNFFNLEILLKLLDDSRNDIYIHIDKKIKKFDSEKYSNICEKSKVKFIKRIDTRWGDKSLIVAEMRLLKEAYKKKYEYYHLLSGSDLPIKSQNYIHNFFEQNKGKEFIDFRELDMGKKIFRIRGYHFTKWTKSKKYGFILGDRIINKVLDFIYLKLKIKRKNFTDSEIKYGSQWFSITNNACEEILKNESKIRKNFFMTSCSDEYFIQTIIYNSQLRKKIYCMEEREDSLGCMRLIDWKRGTPYVFRNADLREIMISDKLFVRKVDENEDKKIIQNIFKEIKMKSERE